jgi:ABC-type transport system involved in cytochrome c biogenesis permease subunit
MEKDNYVQLFHIFGIGIFLIYVGVQRSKLPHWVFKFLIYLGIFIILFHNYKAYTKIKNNKSPWINLFHIIVVAPLLIIIGYNGIETSRPFFEFLIMIGIAAIGYNAFYFYQEVIANSLVKTN